MSEIIKAAEEHLKTSKQSVVSLGYVNNLAWFSLACAAVHALIDIAKGVHAAEDKL